VRDPESASGSNGKALVSSLVGNHGVAASDVGGGSGGSGGGGGGIDKRGNGVAAVRQRCGGAGASKRGKEGRPSMK
jgi:hypothetical protein